MKTHQFVDERTPSEIDLETRHVKVCVWPRCVVPLTDRARIGALCMLHATEVSNALVQIEFKFSAGTGRDLIREARVMQIEREIDAIHRERWAQAESRKTQAGWVYYVSIGDRIKVGFASNVYNRLRSYPPDTRLLAVHPGTLTVEKRMHGLLGNWRAAGREWYDPAPEVMAHIAQVVAQYGEAPKGWQPEFRKPRRPAIEPG